MRDKKETIRMVQRFAAGEPLVEPESFEVLTDAAGRSLRSAPSESIDTTVWERLGIMALVLFLLAGLFFSSLGWWSLWTQEPYFSKANLIAGGTYGLLVSSVADTLAILIVAGIADTIFRFFCWFITGRNKGLFFGRDNITGG